MSQVIIGIGFSIVGLLNVYLGALSAASRRPDTTIKYVTDVPYGNYTGWEMPGNTRKGWDLPVPFPGTITVTGEPAQ